MHGDLLVFGHYAQYTLEQRYDNMSKLIFFTDVKR